MKKIFNCPFCNKDININDFIEESINEEKKLLQLKLELFEKEKQTIIQNEKNKIKENLTNELKNSWTNEIELKLKMKQEEETNQLKKAIKEKEFEILKKDSEMKNQFSLKELELKQKFEDEKNREIKKQVELRENEIRNKIISEQTKQTTIETSSINSGNSFEFAIKKYFEEEFTEDEIKHNFKGSANGDIIQKIKDTNVEILYEVKSGEFLYKSFVEKLKSDMIKHPNVLIGCFITKDLPKTQMLDHGIAIYQVPDTSIFIIDFNHMTNYLPLIRKIAISQYEIKKLKDSGLELTEDQKKSLDLISSPQFKQIFSDMVNNIKILEDDLKKENDEFLKILNTRFNKQKQIMKNIISSSEKMFLTIENNFKNKLLN